MIPDQRKEDMARSFGTGLDWMGCGDIWCAGEIELIVQIHIIHAISGHWLIPLQLSLILVCDFGPIAGYPSFCLNGEMQESKALVAEGGMKCLFWWCV
jgi:hypothetical protein